MKYEWKGFYIATEWISIFCLLPLSQILLTLKVLVTTIDALRHFETG